MEFNFPVVKGIFAVLITRVWNRKTAAQRFKGMH